MEAVVQQTGSGEDTVIQKVTWTGGNVPTEEDSLFQFLATPASSKTYSFAVWQTYSPRGRSSIGPDPSRPTPRRRPSRARAGSGEGLDARHRRTRRRRTRPRCRDRGARRTPWRSRAGIGTRTPQSSCASCSSLSVRVGAAHTPAPGAPPRPCRPRHEGRSERTTVAMPLPQRAINALVVARRR